MTGYLRRREVITLLGGAAVTWPFVARAQPPTMPVIGYLNPSVRNGYEKMMAGFREGMNASGYIEGRDIAFEYRRAKDRFESPPCNAPRSKRKYPCSTLFSCVTINYKSVARYELARWGLI
jgi:hypothetical protein